MNFSTLLGFVLSAVVFFSAVVKSTTNFGIFFDFHAFLIVFGGTCTASLVCFNQKKLFALVKVFIYRIMGLNKRNYPKLIEEVIRLTQAYQQSSRAYEDEISQVTDPFLSDAAEVLFWIESDVPPEQLRDLLETRAGTHFEQYMDQANMFRTISKFPPAFGLLGTTLGMITLLQSLGAIASKNQIGPAMAIGLVATLYGIALSNFLFIPIAENLTKQTKEDMVARRIVVEGIMLIYEKLPPRFVEEKIKSFLLPGERGPAIVGNTKTTKNRMAA